MQNQDGVELRWIIMVLRRWWWVIAVCTLVATVLAIAYTSLSPPQYVATATLLIQPAKDSRSTEASILTVGERLAFTYSQMIKSQPVLQRVIDQEGLEITPNKLESQITASPVTDTQLLRITVRDSSPEQAAYLANTISYVFTSFIKEMNSERFATTLNSMQEKLDELDLTIQQTQSTMNEYRASAIESQADLTNQENNLRDYRSEHQLLQQDYQDLQLTVSQLKENVSVIETAHATESDGDAAYTASVTLFLTDEDLASTYIRILTGQPVLEETIALLGLSESPDELTNWIKVDEVSGTHLIRLRFSDDSEPQAILVADTLAAVFINQVQKLVIEPYVSNLNIISTQLDEVTDKIERTQSDIETLTLENIQSETELGRLEGVLTENLNDYRVIQQDIESLRLTLSDEAETISLSEIAQVPTNPIQRSGIYFLLALGIGLMVGVGLAFFLEYLDDTIKTPQEITETLGLSTLGSIPKVSDGENELVVIEQPRSPTAEAFRMLGTNVRFSTQDKSISTLLVTSPEPRQGKSMIVANMGAALAMLDTKVIIIDADLRLPRQQILFNYKSSDGLTDALLYGVSENLLQSTKIENLSVMTSGRKLAPNPTDLLSSQSMRELLEQFSTLADLIIIDSPPVLNIADTAALSSSVDGVLVVLEAGVTKRTAAQQALTNLDNVGANLIGAVLNSVPKHAMGLYYYYQGISQAEGDIVGTGIARQPGSLPADGGWLQSQGIVPSIRGWFQSKR
jgi:succinoglycan biosynthesis transport protein ExoP